MNKKVIFQRLSIFLIGLPLVLTIVFIKSHAHIAAHCLICLICGLGACELHNMFSKKFRLLNKGLTVFLSVLIPFIGAVVIVTPTFVPSFFKPERHFLEYMTYAFIFAVLTILAVEVLTAKTFEASNSRIAGSVFIVLYTGYLLTFVSRMTIFAKNGIDVSSQAIAVFLLMVFLCDSLAWLFGVLLGKNNRGFIKASPNKSIAGFIGGFIGSIAAGLLGYFFWPALYEGTVLKIIFLSICIAFSSIVGDLAESIFKRSSGIKDSGHIIPGRGGVLDSIDSVLMSAPVYYLLVSILYKPY